MKHCRRCNSVKENSEFNKNKLRKDGLQSYCRACQKEIDKSSYLNSATRRAKVAERGVKAKAKGIKFINRYKRMCKCKVCGESEPVALDLHHLDPLAKEGNPSAFIGYKVESIKKELRKCLVLCANCHRKVHAGMITLRIEETG